MNAPLVLPKRAEIIYPDSDGLPMSDNTRQYEFIVMIKGGLDAVFRNDPNVFVAGNLLWYPVEGNNVLRLAPDVMVAFGRPKGYRGSYRQWVEGGIAPQVVFEILSPSNRLKEMIRKFQLYESFGVQEYYVYNPDDGELDGYQRQGDQLVEIAEMEGWQSPLLGVRFQRSGADLELYRPDGRKLPTYLEQDAVIEETRRQAEQEKQRAEQEKLAAERLRAQLRALGIDPDA